MISSSHYAVSRWYDDLNVLCCVIWQGLIKVSQGHDVSFFRAGVPCFDSSSSDEVAIAEARVGQGTGDP
jgi:hypothetical protein